VITPYPKPPKSKKKNRKGVWDRVRTTVVKPMFQALGVTYCEVTKYEFERGNITKAQALKRNYNLSFHHRHKRDFYKQFKNERELLGNLDQVLLVGQYYHDILEADKEATEAYFMRFRGKEKLPIDTQSV